MAGSFGQHGVRTGGGGGVTTGPCGVDVGGGSWRGPAGVGVRGGVGGFDVAGGRRSVGIVRGRGIRIASPYALARTVRRTATSAACARLAAAE
jgi:hypothetical protein